MGAHRPDPAVLQPDDQIGPCGHRRPVRHDQTGDDGGGAPLCPLHGVLRGGVQAGGRVVHDQQPARVRERPGQPQSLVLTAGQRCVGERCVVPLRQPVHEGVGTGEADGRPDLVAGDGARAGGHRLRDRALAQFRTREGESHLGAQARPGQRSERCSVQQDLSQVGVEQPAGDGGQDGLAGAAASHDRGGPAARHRQQVRPQDFRTVTRDPYPAQLERARPSRSKRPGP